MSDQELKALLTKEEYDAYTKKIPMTEPLYTEISIKLQETFGDEVADVFLDEYPELLIAPSEADKNYVSQGDVPDVDELTDEMIDKIFAYLNIK